MKNRIRGFFLSLLAQDMSKQARQVEFLTLAAIFLLGIGCFLLWQYKIELTAPGEGGRVVIAKMNIFELLLKK